MRFGLGSTVLALGVVAAALAGSLQAELSPQATAAAMIGQTSPFPSSEPSAAAAAGAGVGDWWRKHGQQVVEFAGCMLAGGGFARLLIAGVSGVGGFLAAAGLVVGVLACLA